MADIFVSYARSDRALVTPIVRALEAQGWSVWWDHAIVAGQEFDDRIEAELNAAKAVLVVWTPASTGSRWVRGEAREAAERGVLLPVRFEGARMPIDVRAIHATDLDGWGEDPASPPFQELLRSLTAMTSRPASSTGATVELAAAEAPAAKPAAVGICVLPFSNMSGDAEQEYFSDGISEDVITDLSKVSALSVIARNTAFTFKGKHVDIPQLARQLKVSHVLEGSVRKAGQRVRITAQLIDGATGSHVWAERYDRDLNDIFELQDEISQAIVKALRLKLLPEEKKAIEQRGTTNLEAYNLFLMARQYSVTGNYGNIRRCEAIIRLCRGATQIDPEYATAWALMAVAQAALRFHFSGPGDGGLAAAERALSLDGTLAEAHAAKARVLTSEGAYEQALVEIDIALGLDAESFEVNTAAARLYFTQGLHNDAIRFYEKAVGPDAERFLVGRHADDLLRRHRRRRWPAQRSGADTRARGEDRRPGARQRHGHGLRRARTGRPGRAHAGQGAREARDAARSGQPDHALQLRMRIRAPEGIRHGARGAESRAREGHGRDRELGEMDPDLDAIRAHPRFTAMLAKADARLRGE